MGKLTALVTSALTSAAILAAPAGAPSNSLVFSDQFTRLNTTTWATCYQWQRRACTNEWNDEEQVYVPDQVRARGGVLELTAARETRIGYLADGTPRTFRYVSGMIRQRTPWLYGYVEITAQIPAGRGLWPAFWLLPVSYAWPPEIDVMENLGHEPRTVRMAVHRVDAEKSEKAITTAFPLSSGMHRYGVDWQPGRLAWYLDGRATWTVTDGVPAEPMYLLANLAVGGDWPGPPDAATVFPAVYRIDSIKIWRHKPQISRSDGGIPWPDHCSSLSC